MAVEIRLEQLGLVVREQMNDPTLKAELEAIGAMYVCILW